MVAMLSDVTLIIWVQRESVTKQIGTVVVPIFLQHASTSESSLH